MKRYIVTLIILVVFAGLYAYIRFYETGQVPQEGDEKQIAIYSIKKDEIRKVEIIYPQREVVCEKQKGHWVLKAPEKMRVNETEIDALLDALVDFKVLREIGTQKDLSAFGLKEPSFKVRVTLADGKTYTLLVGTETPTSGKTYVMLENNTKIYTVDTPRVSAFRKEANDLRDKSIASFDREKVNEINVEKEGSIARCLKNRKGEWNIAGAKARKTCESEANAILSTLMYTDVREFVKPRDVGIDKTPSYVLKLKLPGNKEQQILLGERKGDNLYVMNVQRGETYLISGTLADDVEKLFKSGSEK